MALEDEVAAQPGGGELASLIAALNVQPEPVRSAATGLRTAATDGRVAVTAVQSSVTALDGVWRGQSADAFVGYMDGFGAAGTELADAANGVGGALEALAGELESAKTTVRAKGENFLQEVRRLRQSLQGMPQSDVDTQIGQIAAEVARAAQIDVDTAEQALAAALDAVGRYGGAVSSPFSSLPEPGGQPFAPAPGRSVDWMPTPEEAPAPASTVTQSAGGDSGGSGGGGSSSDGGGSSSGGSSSGGSSGGGSSSGASSGGGGGMGSSGGPPAGPPPGNVDQWIREAIRILQENGIPVTEDNIDEIWTIIEKESGGDPNAINDWDSNAAKGTPSKGLMQTIDPTFDAHALPGHTDVWNPVDNIIAGVRYTFDRYGGFENHPGLASMASGGGYQGY